MAEFQVKRGRPKKLSAECMQIYQKSLETLQEKHKNGLSQLQNLYLSDHYSQKIASMLNNFTVLTSFSEESRKSPLKTIIEEAAKTNMISELELSLSSIYLNRLSEKLNLYSTEEILNTVFFRSKLDLENNKSLLKSMKKRLQSQFRHFDELFKIFDTVGDISLSDINKQYQLLNQSRINTINYSYYVDLVLRASPPYAKKSAKKSRVSLNKKCKFEEDETKESECLLTFSEILPLDDRELEIQMPDTIQFIDGLAFDSSEFCTEELNDSDIEFLLDLST